MDLGWNKRPDCDGCKAKEGGFIVLGPHVFCHPCSKKYKSIKIVELIKNSLTKDEIKDILGGDK